MASRPVSSRKTRPIGVSESSSPTPRVARMAAAYAAISIYISGCAVSNQALLESRSISRVRIRLANPSFKPSCLAMAISTHASMSFSEASFPMLSRKSCTIRVANRTTLSSSCHILKIFSGPSSSGYSPLGPRACSNRSNERMSALRAKAGSMLVDVADVSGREGGRAISRRYSPNLSRKGTCCTPGCVLTEHSRPLIAIWE